MLPNFRRKLRGGKVSLGPLIGPLGLIVLLTLCQIYQADAEKGFLSSFKPKRSAKELELDVKIMLNKLKLRQEPQARMNNEVVLSKLLGEKRKLTDEIRELEAGIQSMSGPDTRPGVGRRPDSDTNRPTPRRRFSTLTKNEVEKKKAKLAVKKKQLTKLRNRIQETKNIIAHPEEFISVPSNYGALTPEEVQEEERELVRLDRKNMFWREQVSEGLIEPPLALVDEW